MCDVFFFLFLLSSFFQHVIYQSQYKKKLFKERPRVIAWFKLHRNLIIFEIITEKHKVVERQSPQIFFFWYSFNLHVARAAYPVIRRLALDKNYCSFNLVTDCFFIWGTWVYILSFCEIYEWRKTYFPHLVPSFVSLTRIFGRPKNKSGGSVIDMPNPTYILAIYINGEIAFKEQRWLIFQKGNSFNEQSERDR